MSSNNACEQGYEFALVLIGINSLTTEIENALFEAGCDDATIGVQYGNVYMQFTRTAKSLKDAILSAIRDVRKAQAVGNAITNSQSAIVMFGLQRAAAGSPIVNPDIGGPIIQYTTLRLYTGPPNPRLYAGVTNRIYRRR